MRFSARSFSWLARSRRSASSSAGLAPRGRVPLIGLDSTTPSRPTDKKRSGDTQRSETSSANSSSAPYGTGLIRRSHEYVSRGSMSARAVIVFVRQISYDSPS